MQYYIYILYSELRDRYYIGSSSNPEVRLNRHNVGATPSTKSGRPWSIVYTEHCASKSESLNREKYLKKMKSRVFLEYLIHQS